MAGLWGPESPARVPVVATAAAPEDHEDLTCMPSAAHDESGAGGAVALAAEVEELRARLAARDADLDAARRKLDWFSRTPAYPLYRAIRRLIGTR